jgi:hypothetical protein
MAWSWLLAGRENGRQLIQLDASLRLDRSTDNTNHRRLRTIPADSRSDHDMPMAMV